jgi:hypothetical protein
MSIGILVGTFIVSAILCHFVAKHRGANAVFWGVMGVVFGPLAIPFVFLSKADSNG